MVYNDRSIGIVSYTSKALNQFYGISGLTAKVSDNTSVGINTTATVTLNDGSLVEMKIVNVLSELRTGEFVGWVNGEPYYGPFHVHSGRKMVGAVHVSTPHAYIYETKEASLENPSIMALLAPPLPNLQCHRL